MKDRFTVVSHLRCSFSLFVDWQWTHLSLVLSVYLRGPTMFGLWTLYVLLPSSNNLYNWKMHFLWNAWQKWGLSMCGLTLYRHCDFVRDCRNWFSYSFVMVLSFFASLLFELTEFGFGKTTGNEKVHWRRCPSNTGSKVTTHISKQSGTGKSSWASFTVLGSNKTKPPNHEEMCRDLMGYS